MNVIWIHIIMPLQDIPGMISMIVSANRHTPRRHPYLRTSTRHWGWCGALPSPRSSSLQQPTVDRNTSHRWRWNPVMKPGVWWDLKSHNFCQIFDAGKWTSQSFLIGAGHWHFWKDENSGSNRLHPHEFRSRPNGQMFFGCVQLPFLLAFGLRLTSIWIYLVRK